MLGQFHAQTEDDVESFARIFLPDIMSSIFMSFDYLHFELPFWKPALLLKIDLKMSKLPCLV